MSARLTVALVFACGVAVAAAVGEARLEPPGGLQPARVPQFVLLTHDDALMAKTDTVLRELTEGLAANGCPVTATLFTQVQGTDCELLRKLWEDGFEVADHTGTHQSLKGLEQDAIRDEVVGGRQGLADCGIPIQSIVGMRAPFLEAKPEVRVVLKNNGFLYDSTLIEEGTGQSLSQGMGKRVWPWDMANGIPIDCKYYSEAQKCDSNETYPGVWQVPVWELTALGGPYTMDPGADDKHPVFDILKANFDAAYRGNRAPMPVFVHTPWLLKYKDQLANFIAYATQKQDVYFVTMRQLLAFMRRPIPAGMLTPAKLGCGNAGGAPATPQQLAVTAPKQPPPPSPVRPELVPVPDTVLVPSPLPDPNTPSEPVPELASPSPSDIVEPAIPAPAPSSADRVIPPMPPSGIRITLTLRGTTETAFTQVAEPQLLVVLRQLLAGPDSPVFLASVSTAPAGSMVVRRRRRGLQQDSQQWLQAVAVIGGSQPRQMYQTADLALRDGTIGTVLALSGAYFAASPVIVAFQNGIDLPTRFAASSPSPAAQPTTSPTAANPESSSSSGLPLGAIVGICVGCAAAVIATAGLMYWIWKRKQAGTVSDAAVAKAQAKGKGSSEGSSDTASQGSAPEVPDVSSNGGEAAGRAASFPFPADSGRFQNALYEPA